MSRSTRLKPVTLEQRARIQALLNERDRHVRVIYSLFSIGASIGMGALAVGLINWKPTLVEPTADWFSGSTYDERRDEYTGLLKGHKEASDAYHKLIDKLKTDTVVDCNLDSNLSNENLLLESARCYERNKKTDLAFQIDKTGFRVRLQMLMIKLATVTNTASYQEYFKREIVKVLETTVQPGGIATQSIKPITEKLNAASSETLAQLVQSGYQDLVKRMAASPMFRDMLIQQELLGIKNTKNLLFVALCATAILLKLYVFDRLIPIIHRKISTKHPEILLTFDEAQDYITQLQTENVHKKNRADQIKTIAVYVSAALIAYIGYEIKTADNLSGMTLTFALGILTTVSDGFLAMLKERNDRINFNKHLSRLGNQLKSATQFIGCQWQQITGNTLNDSYFRLKVERQRQTSAETIGEIVYRAFRKINTSAQIKKQNDLEMTVHARVEFGDKQSQEVKHFIQNSMSRLARIDELKKQIVKLVNSLYTIEFKPLMEFSLVDEQDLPIQRFEFNIPVIFSNLVTEARLRDLFNTLPSTAIKIENHRCIIVGHLAADDTLFKERISQLNLELKNIINEGSKKLIKLKNQVSSLAETIFENKKLLKYSEETYANGLKYYRFQCPIPNEFVSILTADILKKLFYSCKVELLDGVCFIEGFQAIAETTFNSSLATLKPKLTEARQRWLNSLETPQEAKEEKITHTISAKPQTSNARELPEQIQWKSGAVFKRDGSGDVKVFEDEKLGGYHFYRNSLPLLIQNARKRIKQEAKDKAIALEALYKKIDEQRDYVFTSEKVRPLDDVSEQNTSLKQRIIGFFAGKGDVRAYAFPEKDTTNRFTLHDYRMLYFDAH